MPALQLQQQGAPLVAQQPTGGQAFALNPDGTIPPQLLPGAKAASTTLSTGSFSGQQVIFTDSITAPTYSWLLQWDSAMTTPGWRFLGGSSIRAVTSALTLPRAGSYDCMVTAVYSGSQTAPVVSGLSFTLSSGSITGFGSLTQNWSAAVGTGVTTITTNQGGSFRASGVSAGATITVAGTGSAAGIGYVTTATPVVIT